MWRGPYVDSKAIAYNNLCSLIGRWILYRIAAWYAVPKPDKDSLRSLSDRIWQQIASLKTKYKLSAARVRNNLIMGTTELRLIIEAAIERCEHGFEMACQDICVHLLLYYTGCRPGSVFPSSHSEYFLPWGNITFLPQRLPDGKGGHVHVGFDVRVMLTNFKGATHLIDLQAK
jgi:hypothetical protein